MPPSASTIDRSGPIDSNGPANACSRVQTSSTSGLSSCGRRSSISAAASSTAIFARASSGIRADVPGIFSTMWIPWLDGVAA